MKKIIYPILILIVILIVSCDKDDSENFISPLPPMSDPNDVCTAMDDIAFMKYCYENFDVNKDGKVSPSEANAVNLMQIYNKGFRSLQGIQYFNNLKSLDCSGNQLTSLDISRNINLENLDCRNNKLNSLIAKNANLKSLDCSTNQLTSLDISENINLKRLDCNTNQIISLDISENNKLTELICWGNPHMELWINSEQKTWADWLFEHGYLSFNTIIYIKNK